MAGRRLFLKLFRTILGGILIIVGIVGIVLPVMPGVLFLIPGLFLLSREFDWAEQALSRVKKWGRRDHKPTEENPSDQPVRRQSDTTQRQ